jgi:glycerol-3-phosphate acyltransferase PlsX
MARVALDAMGGDRAPLETVLGAAAAAERGHDVILVGDRDVLAPMVVEHESYLPIVHAPDVIDMGEDTVRAIREKPEASVLVAARLVRDGTVSALVSAGSTGAALATSAITIGRLEGVDRPAIATMLPTPGSPTVLIDSGANPDCRPEYLPQFALMGAVVAEVHFGVTEPRVGLLNIGHEKGKGRELEKAAYELLEETPLNFVGNIEGRDLSTDSVDVVVTDGFSGNVVLKTTEGTAQFVAQMALDAMATMSLEDQKRVLPVLGGLRARLDYETFGGAHLVGSKGVVVIAHGASSSVAISNAIALAADGADRDLVGRLAARVA